MASSFDLATYPSARNDAGEAAYRALSARRFSNGVWRGESAGFGVTATGTSGMTVQVAPGAAVVDGIETVRSSAATLDIGAASSTQARIDLVVIRLIGSPSPVTGRLMVIQGTPAASPVRPAIIAQTDTALAQITVGAGVTTIQSSAVTDVRTYAATASLPPAAPVLINSWINQTGTPANAHTLAAYWRDGAGVVHLEGHIKGGADGSIAFMLPNGCKPQTSMQFPVLVLPTGYSSGSRLGTVTVNPDGAVVPSQFPVNDVHLNGISFRAYF